MTLTEEILQNISEYEMAPFDAEADVIKAHMEACMRDIQIASECENAGIIMESDSKWNGEIVPKRDGENILKYIFLFIPRLIINFCRKIKAWWESRKQAAIDKAVAEMDEETFKVVEQHSAKICAVINGKLRGGGHLTYTGTGFVYLSRLKSVSNVIETYQTFADRFSRYKENVKIFIDQTNNGYRINPNDTNNYILTELESGSPTMDDLCYPEPTTPISDEGYVEAFPKIQKNVTELSTSTINAMQDVENMYKLVLEHSTMSNENKTLATRYMRLVEKVYNVFVRFENVVQDDLDNAYNAFVAKNELVLKFRKEALKNQETPTAREDLAKKLDKWGVK